MASRKKVFKYLDLDNNWFSKHYYHETVRVEEVGERYGLVGFRCNTCEELFISEEWFYEENGECDTNVSNP